MRIAERKSQRIGLYGGTFDPIHFGHLNLAIQLMEKKQLDQVWWCPAHRSPHKLDTECCGPEHRLAMLRSVVEDIPGFHVIEEELQRGGCSYTIDTVNRLNVPDSTELYLILGDDVLKSFHRWHRVDELLKKVSLLIGYRQGASALSDQEIPEPIKLALKAALTPIAPMEISATEVRRRLAKGLYCGHLVPEKVLGYIEEHELYSVGKYPKHD